MTPGAGIDTNDLLTEGDVLFARGDYHRAAACYQALVQRLPGVAAHQHRMGLVCARLGEAGAARFSFEQALRLDAALAPAHGELARLLGAAGQLQPALDHARRAVELAPGDADLAINLAILYESDRDLDAAWEIVDRVIAEGRQTPLLALLYSRIAASRNRESQALALIDSLLARGSFADARDPSSLHLAAASLLDGLGRYDDAFARAAQGNALRGGAVYSPAFAEKQVDDWIAYFTPDRLRRLPRATHADATPVFIVGMPRSGTSLVEQILASHPAVHGAGELDWVQRLWPAALQRRPIDRVARTAADLTRCIDQLTAYDLDALAAAYLAPLKALAPAAARVVDKMPQNVMNLGLIALLFPQAKVIHTRRDPMDNCLSCHMTDFGVGNEFSRDLAACGHLYRQYDRLMKHWQSVLDIETLDVDYESLVFNLEGQSRRLVGFVGLPWHDRCLDFHNTRRVVATASQSQVRQPIYRSSVGRWRHYRAHLEPLVRALSVEQ